VKSAEEAIDRLMREADSAEARGAYKELTD
jgi:hypothetical protein